MRNAIYDVAKDYLYYDGEFVRWKVHIKKKQVLSW